MFLFPAMEVENQNCCGDFFTLDGGIRKIQIQKQILVETQKLIQIIFSPGTEAPED